MLVAGVLLAWSLSNAALANEAATRVAAIAGASSVAGPDGGLLEIVIPDGSGVTADDIALFADAKGLTKFQLLNCRTFDDAMLARLASLDGLTSLAVTNSGITDAGVATIAASFPNLVELDLSSNTNLTGGAMKSIASLPRLKRLSLVQTRFNDLHTRRLSKLVDLESLDLRGNMEAGDMTLGVVGALPKLRSLKHRSSTITDDGMAALAASQSLEALLAQDFAITNAAGRHLGTMTGLTSLEIFRCQGFGSEGVLALAPLKKLNRLTLRDLPDAGDDGLAVLRDLPSLKRLYLHELASVGDAGLASLAGVPQLEVLDLWSMPKVTDAAAASIASLASLKELSIRETGMTDKALDAIVALPKLESLVFKNGTVSAETAARVKAAKAWKKLDLGQPR